MTVIILRIYITSIFHIRIYERDQSITSYSSGALPSDHFATSLSRRPLLLFHLPTWKYRSGRLGNTEAVDRSNMATVVLKHADVIDALTLFSNNPI